MMGCEGQTKRERMLTLLHIRDFITVWEGTVALIVLTDTAAVDKSNLWITSSTTPREYPQFTLPGVSSTPTGTPGAGSTASRGAG